MASVGYKKLYKPIITCFSNYEVCGDYKYCIIVNVVTHAYRYSLMVSSYVYTYVVVIMVASQISI